MVPPHHPPTQRPLPVLLLVGGAGAFPAALGGRFDVVAAPGMARALAILAVCRPSLIVSAMWLPDGDGPQLLAALDASPHTRDLPALLFNAPAERALAPARPAITAVAASAATPGLPHASASDIEFAGRAAEVALERLSDGEFGVRQLAAALGLSTRHLRRRLASSNGDSPRALLRRLRLHRGAQLLTDSDLSVKQVGYRVGFLSSSGFRDAFLGAYGVTPSVYRAGGGARAVARPLEGRVSDLRRSLSGSRRPGHGVSR